MKLKCTFVSIFFVIVCSSLKSQSNIWDVGLRLNSTIGMYFEHGFTAHFSSAKLLPGNLFFGVTYITSRLGSAIKSNAIKQDNYILSASYVFRKDKIVQPFARINTGFFHADYEYAIFDDLHNKSALLSVEPGITINPPVPLKITFAFGYNIITGDGKTGPGTLYPFYYQMTLLWRFMKK